MVTALQYSPAQGHGVKSGEKIPIIAFDRRLVALVYGDALTVLLLSQIIYWHGKAPDGQPRYNAKDRDGTYWFAKSAKEFEQETLLSSKQIRRCLQTLVDIGLIEIKLMRFNSHPTTHIRFVHLHGVRGVVTVEDVLNLKLKNNSHLPFQHNLICPFGQISFSQKGKYTTEIKSEIGTETTTQLASEVADQPNPEIPAEVETEKDKQMQASEILEKFKQGHTSGKTTGSAGTKAMSLLWKKRVATEYGGYQKNLTAKEVGQLGHVYKAIGDQAVKVMDYALQYWQVFASEVQTNKGLMPPMQPVCGFFCSHWETAANLMDKHDKQQKAGYEIPVPLQSVAKPVPKIVDNVEHDQLEPPIDAKATFAALAAVYAAKEK